MDRGGCHLDLRAFYVNLYSAFFFAPGKRTHDLPLTEEDVTWTCMVFRCAELGSGSVQRSPWSHIQRFGLKNIVVSTLILNVHFVLVLKHLREFILYLT